MDTLFATVIKGAITGQSFLICTAASVVLGLFIGGVSSVRRNGSRGFSVSLALLPLIVQVVVMLVNGNLGTAVAITGAFSLVRFRSAPGSARDIAVIFAAMATGLATGTGYIGVAAILAVLVMLLHTLYCSAATKGMKAAGETEWKITVPEDLAAEDAFDDLWEKYTKRADLMRVKTSHLGSLYQLTYRIALKNGVSQKVLMDEIRCRNGNLEIVVSLPQLDEKSDL